MTTTILRAALALLLITVAGCPFKPGPPPPPTSAIPWCNIGDPPPSFETVCQDRFTVDGNLFPCGVCPIPNPGGCVEQLTMSYCVQGDCSDPACAPRTAARPRRR